MQVAADADDELLRIYAQIRLSTMLTIGGSNPAWVEPFSTVPFKVVTDTVELTVMNMWCGEDKHPTVVVKLK